MNLGSGGYNELRSCHCTPAWAAVQDLLKERKKEGRKEGRKREEGREGGRKEGENTRIRTGNDERSPKNLEGFCLCGGWGRGITNCTKEGTGKKLTLVPGALMAVAILSSAMPVGACHLPPTQAYCVSH